jgi:adenylate cyclase class IV
MRLQLIRLIKAFCPDFQPIRRILTSIGAVWMEQTAQSDYFFRLPIHPDAPASRRLRLRVENHQPRCIYYYDRAQDHVPIVTFQRFEMRDPVMQDILATALGIATVVHKQREVWRTEHGIFHLDHVHGVGQIFEVELEVAGPDRRGPQADYYRQLFWRYLGAEIHGSNEDLVAALLEKPAGDRTG